jgi:spermidine/putrescine transport system permease protein
VNKKRPFKNCGRGASTALTVAVISFLYIPIVIIVAFAFNDQRANTEWIGFTTKWFTALFGDGSMLEVIKNTLIVGLGSTVLAVFIGTIGAVGLTRFNFSGKSIISNALYVPMVIPEIVMAVALLSIFTALQIPLGLTAIILGHTALTLPFVIIEIKTSLAEYDQSLEEASMDLGANRKETFCRVTLPLVMPGVMSGAFLAFSLSLDDLIITSFLSSPDSMTLPVLIYSQVKVGISPEINVLYTFIIAMLLIVVLIPQIVLKLAHPDPGKKG